MFKINILHGYGMDGRGAGIVRQGSGCVGCFLFVWFGFDLRDLIELCDEHWSGKLKYSYLPQRLLIKYKKGVRT